jgi:hypothetical protein
MLATIAMGMAKVKAIADQQMGGGAAVAPTGAGASYNPVTPTRPAEGVNAGGAQEKAMTVNFHITGAVLDKESLVESIADTMEEFAQDKRLNFKLQYEK